MPWVLLGCGGGAGAGAGTDGAVAMSGARVGEAYAATNSESAVIAAQGASRGNTVVISARGTPAAGVQAALVVRVDGQVTTPAQVFVTSTDANYTFTSSVPISANSVIDVVFPNDAWVNNGAEDRNLFVNNLAVNGQNAIAPSAAGVQYDRGEGASAFDGVDVISGQGVMAWSGALRLRASVAGVATSASSTSATTTAASTTNAAATTWTECAREGGTCSFTGSRQVRYGGKQAGQQMVTKTVTGPVVCNDGTFGTPFSNYENFCWVGNSTASVAAAPAAPVVTAPVVTAPVVAAPVVTAPAPAPAAPSPTTTVTWTECAREGGTCSFAGNRQVRYGGKQAGQQLVTKTLTGPVVCNDGAFGTPFSNYENFCWVGSEAAATATAPTPSTPAVTPSTPVAQTPTTQLAAAAPATTSSGPGPRVSSFVDSGAIVARSGQVISGVRISNSGGACVVIPPGVTGVVIRDSQIGPCQGDASIVVQGNNATIEHNTIGSGRRGILVNRATGSMIRANVVNGPFAGNSCGVANNPSHCSSAIQFDNADNGTVDSNRIRGTGYGSDTLSSYESSGMRFVNNDIDVGISWPHSAPFTMGDSTTGRPGSNNYVAGNVVRQTGGVPPGVFGSGGNTILERNCLTSGIQAYNYSGIFNGVSVRANVIGPGSFTPDTGALSGWNTNVFGTDCSRVPG